VESAVTGQQSVAAVATTGHEGGPEDACVTAQTQRLTGGRLSLAATSGGAR
jgi:hypothetical protein